MKNDWVVEKFDSFWKQEPDFEPKSTMVIVDFKVSLVLLGLSFYLSHTFAYWYISQPDKTFTKKRLSKSIRFVGNLINLLTEPASELKPTCLIMLIFNFKL